MTDAVIVDILRIPFSRSRPAQPERDAYNKQRMDEALANVIKELIRRNNVNPEEIGDLITGCALQMREHYLMGGRTVAMLAELPVCVPAQSIDRVCISGMSALHQCSMEIMLGYSDICIASGMEHMTHVPLDARFNADLMMVSPRFWSDDSLKKYELQTALSMGLTAEKLCSLTNIPREEMDEWSLWSHQRAAKAVADGYFTDEILPLDVEQEDGSIKHVDTDLSIRADTSMESLSQLTPSFKPDGTITAGNSSPLNAGASSVLLMSAEKAKSMGLKPLAKVISMGWAGVDPSIMGVGPVPASKKALEKIGMDARDIDYWEINEAFSIVALYAIKEMGLDPNSVNVKGGAVALGHPLSASGPRLTGTLARILHQEGGKYGAATLCGGGGQGGTVIIEKI
ncbi:MAG: acetyl-CoA C-acyltransferase [Candidatus Anoxymicrobium japonicum]|uniref:Acetyl-CoA C-acyltransferase n=1 Tax=Candidatus Anoxymicrobium japonicum TaxID=2013648 RepID=A0A2N3G4I4_9ACTN|nr:MAG: acetyl-CoA C-acyltransferase [Candidatus Anoxymicrobium japonicum]